MSYKRYSVNTVLQTKDGRKVGNAIVVGYAQSGDKFLSIVKTDYGNTIPMSNDMIEELFHPPDSTFQLFQDRMKNHKHWVTNS